MVINTANNNNLMIWYRIMNIMFIIIMEAWHEFWYYCCLRSYTVYNIIIWSKIAAIPINKVFSYASRYINYHYFKYQLPQHSITPKFYYYYHIKILQMWYLMILSDLVLSHGLRYTWYILVRVLSYNELHCLIF